MWSNYRTWRINLHDFQHQKTDRDRLRFFLRFAVLAPSSHNSQPWKLTIKGNSILVMPEECRTLTASDRNKRQLFISLGCAVENFIIAADYYGFGSNISYIPTDGVSITLERIGDIKKQNQHPIFAIPHRHTNRNRYRNTRINVEFFEKILQFSNTEYRIDIIQEIEQRSDIADVVIRAGIAAMEDKDFRHELSQYVKNNLTLSKVGMPAFGMGIPTIISFFAPFMVRHFNMNKITRKKDKELLKEHTPYFLLISTKEDKPESWLNAGRIFERIALEAELRNIKTAPMAAPIQIGEFYKKLQNILGTSFRPQVFCRIGYTDKRTPHSPRMSVEEVTEL